MLRRDIYEKMLSDVGREAHSIPESTISLFTATWGRQWTRGVLVYGRAVNGAESKAAPMALTDSSERSRLIDDAFRREQDLEWVEALWGNSAGCNTKRSAFWRVVRAYLSILGNQAEPPQGWADSLAWSNLYKVAPGKRGNPSGPLQRLQLLYCQELFIQEIADLRPNAILCLTGWDWAAPFLLDERLRFQPEFQRDGYVQKAGFLSLHEHPMVPVLVARHPQGKPHDAFVRELQEAYNIIKRSKPA